MYVGRNNHELGLGKYTFIQLHTYLVLQEVLYSAQKSNGKCNRQSYDDWSHIDLEMTVLAINNNLTNFQYS